MQNETRFNHATMVSPSAGFTSRVMARIEERERARARQRALIGAGLLVAAAVGVFALLAVWIAAWLGALLASPGAILTALLAVAPLAGELWEALWVASLAILQNVNGGMLLTYALIVLALTVVWARVVTGSLQRSLPISVGGQRK
jgi:anti-sigma factor RsiW